MPTTSPDTCAHCGGKIPPRSDPRGRKARYCSDACRAAASRERRRARHAEELREAREQATLEFHSPDDFARGGAQILREIAAEFRRGEPPLVTHAAADLIAASDELSAAKREFSARESAKNAAPPRMNRRQRRAAKRRR